MDFPGATTPEPMSACLHFPTTGEVKTSRSYHHESRIRRQRFFLSLPAGVFSTEDVKEQWALKHYLPIVEQVLSAERGTPNFDFVPLVPVTDLICTNREVAQQRYSEVTKKQVTTVNGKSQEMLYRPRNACT